jgi:hypothetical protein
LTLATSGGTGTAYLLVKFGPAPTRTSFDFFSGNAGTAQNVAIQNPQAGAWYAEVFPAADFSGVELAGDYAAQSGNVQDGEPVLGLEDGHADDFVFFDLEVPPGSAALQVSTSGGSGGLFLYVRRQFLPTAQVFDAASFNPGSTVEADSPLRRKVLDQINDLGKFNGSLPLVPVFISSRYVTPRLDNDLAMTGAQLYHVAGLAPDQVVSHVAALRERLAAMAERAAGLGRGRVLSSLEGQARRVELLAKQLADLERAYADSRRPAADTEAQTEGRVRGTHIQLELAYRTFSGLALPLFLHLYLGLWLERGPVKWSLESLIGRYVEFLFGKWCESRSELPGLDLMESGRASLVGLLAYLGFEFTLREHVGLADPTPGEVEELLVAYCRAMDQAAKADEELTDFVRAQMDLAQTAEIFEPDSPENIRFRSPADVLCDYHLAQFIEHSTRAYEAKRARDQWRPDFAPDFPPSEDATYSAFLNNPNLRFLERGQIIYFQSAFDGGKAAGRFVLYRFEEALYTQPIKLELCGCSDEQLRQIAPLNLVFLGRALQGDVRNEYADLRRQLEEELRPIHRDTNFETVYTVLRDIVLPFRAHLLRGEGGDALVRQIADLNPKNDEDIERMDEMWRRLPNADLLIQLGRQVQAGQAWDALGLKRKVLLRRIAYELRYHAATFDDLAGDWLVELHRQAGPNVQDMAMATARVLRTRADVQHRQRYPWWTYFASFEQQEGEEIQAWRRQLRRAWQACKPEKFVERVVTDNTRFPFKALQRLSPDVRKLLWERESRAPEAGDVQAAVAVASRLLEDVARDSEEEKKVHLVLREVAYDFRGRQFLMPEEYPLRSDRTPRPRDVGYRPEDILLRLFESARAHLPQAGDKLKLAGEDRSNPGGLQPYDLAVEVIWSVLYGPSPQDVR